MKYKEGEVVWCTIYEYVKSKEGLMYCGPAKISEKYTYDSSLYRVTCPITIHTKDGHVLKAGHGLVVNANDMEPINQQIKTPSNHPKNGDHKTQNGREQ